MYASRSTWPSPASCAIAGIKPLTSNRRFSGTLSIGPSFDLWPPATWHWPRGGQAWLPIVGHPSWHLVPDLPQERLPVGSVCNGLHAPGRKAVHHAHHAPSLTGHGDDHLDGIRRCAVDAAHLLALLDGIENVDGIGIPQHHGKEVARRHRVRVPNGRVAEGFV